MKRKVTFQIRIIIKINFNFTFSPLYHRSLYVVTGLGWIMFLYLCYAMLPFEAITITVFNNELEIYFSSVDDDCINSLTLTTMLRRVPIKPPIDAAQSDMSRILLNQTLYITRRFHWIFSRIRNRTSVGPLTELGHKSYGTNSAKGPTNVHLDLHIYDGNYYS